MTGAFIFGCAGPSLTAAERSFFREAQPWGFILFARNVDDKAQLRALTSDLREAVGRDAPILIDQEGGRVQRMGPPIWRGWAPPLEALVDLPLESRALGFALRYQLIAAELREVGIDVNCAPVGDIAMADTHPILRNRCYGDNADTVTALARAVAEGLLAGGVLPVMKHMPGHGRATVDSHLDLPRVTTQISRLEREDFHVFRSLRDLPLGMTSHLVYEEVDGACPVTLSTAGIDMIRTKLAFDGVLMTDDISMNALSGPVGERGRRARAAGCDVVLHCNGVLDEMAQIAGAVGSLDARGTERATRALSARPMVDEVDVAALEADYRALGGTDGRV